MLDPFNLIIVVFAVALIPFLAVVATSFVKISVILLLVRNALGVQQIPPNMALNALAIILSGYIMAPTLYQSYKNITATSRFMLPPVTEQQPGQVGPPLGGEEVTPGVSPSLAPPPITERPAVPPGTPQSLRRPAPSPVSTRDIAEIYVAGRGPILDFLNKHAAPKEKVFFLESARRLWPEEMLQDLSEQSLFVVLPAFTVSQLREAFEIGFLLYLPFIAIDLVVSNILLALGMMMVSPLTISLPFKLFLFVMVDGWSRLILGIVSTYV